MRVITLKYGPMNPIFNTYHPGHGSTFSQLLFVFNKILAEYMSLNLEYMSFMDFRQICRNDTINILLILWQREKIALLKKSALLHS